MTRRVAILVFLFSSSLVLWSGCDSSDLVPEPEPTLAERLQATLDNVRTANSIQGISAAVMVSGQEPWRGASGTSVANEPITPTMFFGIASITKNYIAVLTLKLAEEGLLTLDDSLSRWLPPFLHIDETITLRQLLNHTSGLAN